MNNEVQIVYVLTNPSMPGLIKIGITAQVDVESRMRQLYTTGVPVPFECHYACRVKAAPEAERALHFAFGDSRVNPNREFFTLEPERVVAVLKLIQIEEVTNQIKQEMESEESPEDRESGDRLRRRTRRPNLNFIELGIPLGSTLKFRGGDEEVKVIGEKRVEYLGEQISLTAATRKILGHESDYPLQPSPYWLYHGRRLDEIYEEYHSEEDAA